MKTLAVINPRSGNGRTGRARNKIIAALSHAADPLSVAFTNGPMEATAITQQALIEGFERIVAVGGDGTINEVVNGFFRNGVALNPDAQLGLVSHGTGGDFRRTFGIEDGLAASVARIAAQRTRLIDVGRLSFVTDDGKPGLRYFNNIASMGLSGEVVRRVNTARWTKVFGGRFTFSWSSLMAMLGFKGRPIRLKVDSSFDQVVTISTVAICNGQYFGGGMKVAPDAQPDDGLFDVIIMAHAPRSEMMRSLNKIYKGEHIHSPHVRVIRGRSVIATPVEATGGAPVFLDVDGEGPGQLPALFEVLPKAIKFVC